MTRKHYASNAALEAMDAEQAVDYLRAGRATVTDSVHRYLTDLGATDDGLEFGPGLVTDLCRCGHERGSHWDGEGACDPATCGCVTFRGNGGEW